MPFDIYTGCKKDIHPTFDAIVRKALSGFSCSLPAPCICEYLHGGISHGRDGFFFTVLHNAYRPESDRSVRDEQLCKLSAQSFRMPTVFPSDQPQFFFSGQLFCCNHNVISLHDTNYNSFFYFYYLLIKNFILFSSDTFVLNLTMMTSESRAPPSAANGNTALSLANVLYSISSPFKVTEKTFSLQIR